MKNLILVIIVLFSIITVNAQQRRCGGTACMNEGSPIEVIKHKKKASNWKAPKFKKGESSYEMKVISAKPRLNFSIDTFLLEAERQEVNIATTCVTINGTQFFLTSKREKGNFNPLGKEADYKILNGKDPKGFRILTTKTFFLIEKDDNRIKRIIKKRK